MHPTTLFSHEQLDLEDKVRLWLKSLKMLEVVCRGPVQQAFAERIADWRKCTKALHNHTETQNSSSSRSKPTWTRLGGSWIQSHMSATHFVG